jgi:eukaryotic-like serine/threonine-protein kinase
MGFRQRLEWLGRMIVLAFILGSAAFLSAITAMRFAIVGREVVTPDIMGKKVPEAEGILALKGLGLVIADRVYSGQPVDLVVRQSPPPGTRVKVGQRVHVVLSLGSQRVTIPGLEKKSLRAARIELLSDGLQVGEITSFYLPEQLADTIVEQDPAPGTTNAATPRVSVLVSLGARPAAYVMPDLTGLGLGEAQKRLAGAGLRVARITNVPSAAAAGTVIDQLPARGARVDGSTNIELRVAEQAPPTAVLQSPGS